MRNLRISSQRHLRLDLQHTRKDAATTRLRAVAFDARTDEAAYAATTSASPLTATSLVDIDVWRLWPRQRHVASFSAPVYQAASRPVDTAIIAFDFLADGGAYAQGDAALCLISAGGDIALTPLDGDDGDVDGDDRNRRDNDAVLPEIVGSVEQGILAACWSPDQELLVLVTAPTLAEDGTAKGSTLLLMTREFEVLSEEPLQTDDFGEEQPITLGWGSKATQFHGSEGKEAAAAAAAAQTQHGSMRGPPLAGDDGRPRISWRGDSAVFAISTLDAAGPHRVIRTFGKNANLLATSDPSLRGVSHALAFKPSGILMATTQLSDDGQHSVAFIERNGLPKGSFALRDADPIRELAWNSDGSLLAVWTSRTVQIWSTGNYHWYLKQQFVPDIAITSVRWNAERPLDLLVSSAVGAVAYRFVLDTCVSSSQCAPNEASCAAVVDGRDVLLTPFRLQNIPPPSCSVRLKLDAIPIDVGWATVCLSPHDSVSFLHVLLPRGMVQIWVFEWGNLSAKRGVAATWQTPWQLCTIDFGLAARQVAAYAHRKGDYVKLAVGVLAVDGFESLKLATRKVQWKTRSLGSLRFESLSLGKPAQRMLIAAPQDAERHDVVVARNVFAHENKLLRNIAGERVVLPAFFPHLMLLSTDPDDVHLVGLTEAGQLFLNSKLLARDANSFVLTDSHLVWTNVAHEARFLPIASALTLASSHVDVDADDGVDAAAAVHGRRIERGARIVTAVPSSMTLVLQMPRGNLETVSPRPLVLEAVSKSVKGRRYGRAFRICRTHRLDMSILVDYDEARFLHDVPLFVRQVKDGEHLNLFLSSLSAVAPPRFQPAARTVGVRPKTGGGSRAQVQAATERQTRINAICDAVREALQAGDDGADARDYVNTILTTHVRKSPPDYAAALQLLADLKVRDPAAADEACRYVIFLTDADKLFDAALGTYDFTLPLLVAHHSPRKDPREYLPFLRELRDVQPVAMQRFRIDETLQRWDKALEWLVKAGDDEDRWERAKAFIEEHALYASGVRLYAAQPTRLAEVQEMYGDWLMAQRRYKEAGVLFGRCGAVRKAVDADVKSGSWREALATATAQGGGGDDNDDNIDIRKLAQSIAASLKGYARYTEAATVVLTYLDDVEDAVRLLCKDLEFGEAKRVAAQHGRAAELIDSVLRPCLLDSGEALLDDVKEMHDQGAKQFARLQELRLRKRERPDEYYPDMDEGGGNGEAAGLDSASRAFTTFTRFTRYSAFTTNAAAARRRRQGDANGDDSSSRMSQFTMRTAAGSATTAKGRKKEMRRQGTGKKNSIYEEEYLFGSLGKVVGERLEKVQRDADKVLLQVARLSGPMTAVLQDGDEDEQRRRDDDDKDERRRCQQMARQLHDALDSFELAMREASETLWLDGLDDEDALEEERLQAIQEGVSLGLSWPQLQANGLFSAPLHREKVAVAAFDWRQATVAAATNG